MQQWEVSARHGDIVSDQHIVSTTGLKEQDRVHPLVLFCLGTVVDSQEEQSASGAIIMS